MESLTQDIEIADRAPTSGIAGSKRWKEEGYPAFSQWVASSEDFLVLRRFTTLNSRALLFLQDRISQLDGDLRELDEAAKQGPDELGDSSTIREDPRPERIALLEQLVPLLQQYNEFLLAYQQVKSWKSAQRYHVENIENWFYNHPTAIADEEQEFIRKKDDLIAPVARIKSPVRRVVEQFPILLGTRLFRSQRESHISSCTTTYYSHTKLDSAVYAVIIVAGLLLLISPMWALQFVTEDVKRLAIITGFILVFTALLSSATVAKPFEVLAATAAYSAVLMVFLQMGHDSS